MDIVSSVAKISKYFELPRLELTKLSEALAKEDTCYKQTIAMHRDMYVFGIEVEVEGCDTPKNHCNFEHYWAMTTDGSLRNNGVEYVSVPLRMNQIEGAFKQLDSNLPATADFSPRTSIHIHMNVRDLVQYQIANIVLLYTAVENLLFKWVGHSREENIFCIKLTETAYARLFHYLNQDIRIAVDNWNKYTALNIAPIASKGTVEFRHMHGTRDFNRVIKWINMLACIKTAAKEFTTQELFNLLSSLNSTSLYDEFIIRIFGDYAKELLMLGNLQEEMETAVTYVKMLQAFVTQEEQTIPRDLNIEFETDARPIPTLGELRRTTPMPRTRVTREAEQLRAQEPPLTPGFMYTTQTYRDMFTEALNNLPERQQ